MRAALLLLGLFAACASAEDNPEQMLLRIRDKCVSSIQRLPRYMCTESIYRDYLEPLHHVDYASCDDLLGIKRRRPPEMRRTASDRLRLNVSVTSAHEIFSWVGQTSFDDRGLFGLVDRGPLQTGAFASFLRIIFGNDEAEFSYLGESDTKGRRIVEFSFQTRQEKSHYWFGTKETGVRVAYEGKFTADAGTLDLLHLVIRTLDLPPDEGTCEATTILDYHVVRLRDADFLLPAASELQMIQSTGDENLSRTTFSACHEFLGESTLKFDVPDMTSVQRASPETAPLALPRGISFGVALTEGIATGTAAAGDQLRGRLTSAIRNKKAHVEIPAGTPVTGRIVRLEHAYENPGAVTLAIRFETLEVNGSAVPFTARIEVSNPLARRSPGFGLQTRGQALGSIGDLGAAGTVVYRFQGAGENYLVKSGLETHWVTLGK